MVAAKSGFGVRLQKGDGGSPEAFTTVAGIKSIDGPNSTADVLDATDNDDVTNGRSKWVKKGWVDNGEINIKGNLRHSDTTQKGMQTGTGSLASMTTATNFKIVDSAAATVFGPDLCWVFKFSRTQPHDNLMEYDIGLRLESALTVA